MSEENSLPVPLGSNRYCAENANLAGSVFHDVSLEAASFQDVNLRSATFEDVALTGATIRNACLKGVSIADANYEGMLIEGILVTDLLAAWKAGPRDQGEGEPPGEPLL